MPATATEYGNKVKDPNRTPSMGQMKAHKRYCRICNSEHCDDINALIIDQNVRPGEVVEAARGWGIDIDYESISRHKKYLPYLVAGAENTQGLRNMVLSSEATEFRADIAHSLGIRERTAAEVATSLNRSLTKVLDVIEAKAEDATFDALVRAADVLSRAAAVASGQHPDGDRGGGSNGNGTGHTSLDLSAEATETLEEVLSHIRANGARDVTPVKVNTND